MLNLGYRNFTLIFFRIYFLSIATFFLKLWLSVCHLNIFQDVLTFISGISSFENRLSSPCSSNSFYFETKIMEGSQKLWNSFFFFYALFLKICSFKVVTFCLAYTYPVNSIFSVIVCIYETHISDEEVFTFTNHYYDNWNIVFFLFPWQSLLGRQISSSSHSAYQSKLSL